MNLKENFSLNKAHETLNKYKSELQIIINKLGKKGKLSIGAGLLCVAVAIAGAAFATASTVYILTADSIELGYVDDTAKITEMIETVKADLSKETGATEVVFDSTKVVWAKADANKQDVDLLSSEELKAALSNKDYYTANAWAIKIAGKSVAAAGSEEAANGVLESLKIAYKTDGTELISAAFKEDVAIIQEMTSLDMLMAPEAATQLILTGTKEPKTYTVKDGDTMWDIAQSSSMNSDELAAANPGFDPSKLHIGQVLNMFEKKPYVTIITTEKIAESKKIDYKTVYESTDALYKGEVKVKTAGVYGEEQVLSEVVKENGVWVSTKVLGTTVVSEPSQQIALKGTKSLSTFTGSGNLSSPLSGAISSGFGSRGGGRHTGIDIPAPKGTAIKAADAGVVTFVGTSGAYGKLVKLSHGNGIATWYSHCNGYNVAVGDIVTKGQVIAYVGITGRATGYHCHFEVRKNGTPVNPLNYL